jgi:glutaminyl-peptide cyclotransferase
MKTLDVVYPLRNGRHGPAPHRIHGKVEMDETHRACEAGKARQKFGQNLMKRNSQRELKLGARKPALLWFSAILGILVVIGCDQGWSGFVSPGRDAVAVYDYSVVNVYPHDPEAFTQGLVFRDGFLYESTGLNGRSTLRKVRLETGEVVNKRILDATYFAEGLTAWGNRLIQLTWKSNTGFIYDLETFVLQKTFRYSGEGWGIAHDGARLIMSDGTSKLRFLDPETLLETRQLVVVLNEKPVDNLNELEVVEGKIFANVWRSSEILIISPMTGRVTGRVDLRGLLSAAGRMQPVDVLNGIAYDARHKRLFVTGKLWKYLFEIRLKPRP